MNQKHHNNHFRHCLPFDNYQGITQGILIIYFISICFALNNALSQYKNAHFIIISILALLIKPLVIYIANKMPTIKTIIKCIQSLFASGLSITFYFPLFAAYVFVMLYFGKISDENMIHKTVAILLITVACFLWIIPSFAIIRQITTKLPLKNVFKQFNEKMKMLFFSTLCC